MQALVGKSGWAIQGATDEMLTALEVEGTRSNITQKPFQFDLHSEDD